MFRQISLAATLALLAQGPSLLGAVIPVTDANVLASLSPYNWVCQDDAISSTVNGASVTLRFKRTREVALQVSTDHMPFKVPTRFPIIAWSVNGGPLQTHQLAAGETSVPLAADVADPAIDLYIKGMSPFEDRYTGDVPPNAVKITGFAVAPGGAVIKPELPAKVWLNIGDSIMSGDGALYAQGQGRPPDNLWAASEDGRASYGYLLARHYGYRESRLAYGGYNWAKGMAKVPALSTLIDQRTSTISRLRDGALSPAPDVVLINLGANGPPAETNVTQALTKLRSRVKPATKIIVMVPVSGRARGEVTRAFNSYKDTAQDDHAYLVDLHRLPLPTCDGVHPTAAGHELIYQAALPAFDAILGKAAKAPGDTSLGPPPSHAEGHPFACADYTAGKVCLVGADGKIQWEYPAPSCNDLWVLPNGNLLFTTGHGVKELTRDKQVVFNYQSQSEIYACQRLANGNTFIGECNAGRLLEADPRGQIVKELKLLPPGKDGGHLYMRNARRLANGHYLVAHYGEQVVREYDPQGKVVREIPAAGGPHSAIRLANGNTLIACGDFPGGHRVFEADPAGQTVWQLKDGDLPGIRLYFMTGLQRLPNGNTLVSNWLGHGQFGHAPHLIEVTPDKHVLWTFADHQAFKTIATVQLLDLPGDVTQGEIAH